MCCMNLPKFNIMPIGVYNAKFNASTILIIDLLDTITNDIILIGLYRRYSFYGSNGST